MASNYDFDITASSNASSSVYTDKTRKVNNSLGQDEFLKLLVTQMENQDPLNPTSDTEWIAQMAQFTALEQMQAMNTATQSQRAYSLIGKEVTANEVVDSEGNSYAMEVYGNVTGVSKLNGIEYLVVYDYANEIEVLVPPSAVRTVFDAPDATTTMQLESIYNLIKDLFSVIESLVSQVSELSALAPQEPVVNNYNTYNTYNTVPAEPDGDEPPPADPDVPPVTDPGDNVPPVTDPDDNVPPPADPDDGGTESTVPVDTGSGGSEPAAADTGSESNEPADNSGGGDTEL